MLKFITYMYKTDLRILRFTVITITSGRVLKRMVAKFISITRINKKILVKSEVDNPSARDTGDFVCCGKQAA